MINVGIIGSTGYAGSELVRLLSNHRHVCIKSVCSKSYAGNMYKNVYPNFNPSDLVCEADDMEKLAKECDVIFLALPHGEASRRVNADILDKCRIIDLGADFRLQNIDVYESWYCEHYSKDILKEAVYGLCEINREKIKGRRIIGNPGCYTTCSILSLYPLVKEGLIEPDSIIIDAKSGVSGAGRGLSAANLFCEVNESVKAYKIASHRHTPEIEEQLSYACGREITISFTPHLIPMNRGILATCYASLTSDADYDRLREAYEKYYGNEYFIRIMDKGVFPETRWVKNSNFFDVGFTVDKRTNRVIAVGAIDNLFKGAAGQAVQNMNILFGFDEKEGIGFIPPFPV